MTEDPRKTALKNGLRQLSLEQIRRLWDYEGPLQLDKFNYKDGCYCPLAVGVGLHEWVVNPSHEKVYAILAMGGLIVNSTWEVDGEFYRDDRENDLWEAVYEVGQEKWEEFLGPNEFGDPVPPWTVKERRYATQ